MSSPPTIEPFKGTNWEECDDFIRAIRTAAWKEGKIQDPRWIADFASLHFSRKARLWHSRLPQDVLQDWQKLEAALLDRWTPPEDEDDRRIEPTPAAAPSLNRSHKANLTPQGALKVVVDGSNGDCYLKIADGDGRIMVTENANQALHIRCNSLSNTTILERMDGSRHSWLAVQWNNTNPNLTKGSTDWGYLVLLDSFTLKTSWDKIYPYQLASCTLSTDDEVIPVWEKNDTSRIAIGIFSATSGMLCIAADPGAYSRRFFDEKGVKFSIEPIH